MTLLFLVEAIRKLEQFLEKSNSGFWGISKNADGVRTMFARRKAERLDSMLAIETRVGPSGRGARL